MPGSWHPNWHYDTRAFHEEGTSSSALCCLMISLSIDVSHYLETTRLERNPDHQTSPSELFFDFDLSAQSLNH